MEEFLNLGIKKEISEPQRKCLSHVLRNCLQSVEGLLEVIEDRYSVLSLDDLAVSLENTCKHLEQVYKAAQRGSFCAISEKECNFVSYFVGCNGKPDIGINNTEKLKVLE